MALILGRGCAGTWGVIRGPPAPPCYQLLPGLIAGLTPSARFFDLDDHLWAGGGEGGEVSDTFRLLCLYKVLSITRTKFF